MAETLDIGLLGGLQISKDGVLLGAFISSKVPALLAYLAVTGRPHQREALAGLLWGEMSDDAAANNLRQALTNLRKLVEPHVLITRETVAFNRQAPYCLDVESFSALTTQARSRPAAQRPPLLQQALDLYRGDFLDGFHVRDAPDFEDWVLTQRVQLREQALQGWDALTSLLLDAGDYQGAVDASGRLLAMDPWREEAHCQRMLALARSGQRSAALAQYRTCRTILRQEFDAEPSTATTALYERIRASLRGPRHNLPAALTGFVGREVELAELRSLLASPDTRLLTLLGPGGVGKTRLALEVAAACEPAFLNGAWFVPLATNPPASRDALAMALADALELTLAGQDAPVKQVASSLQHKELLLVLDNLEEWLDAAAWLSDLLAQAPAVKILATSRERLDLQAERAYPLAGLPIPAVVGPDLASSAAAELFARRARRVWPAFTLNGEDGAAVARICRLVEGLPLGIELAAAWVHQLTCAQIAAEIEGSLDFLATSRRDASPRQRSLRAVFDWSWGRLTSDEQAAFPRLAVFSGPFSRTAASQVAGASPAVLAALADKSLAWRRGDVYQLHEVARQFGREKLALAGAVEETQARHARYYAHLLAQHAGRLTGQEQEHALVEVERKADNVRVAWQWLVQQRDVDGIAAATDGLYHFLAIRSRFREGLELFRAARLALLPLAADDRAARLAYSRAMAREGRFLSFLSQYEGAAAMLSASLTILRELEEVDEMAFVLGHLGGTARMQGNLEVAELRLWECLALRRQTGNLHGQAVALLELGGVAFVAADHATARDRCAEGLAIAERAGDLQTTAHLLTGLSLSHRELGQPEPALEYGRRGLAIYEQLGDQYGVIQATLSLGELSRQLGDLAAARRFCQRAVQVSQEIGHRSGEADGHYRLGQIAAGLSQADEALRELRLAVNLASEIQEHPLILSVLLELGCLLSATGDAGRAREVLNYLIDQPQLPEPRRVQAKATLARLSAPPPPTRAEDRAPSLDSILSLVA